MDKLSAFDPLYIGFIGLFIGSFLNVCIARLPVGESIVRPPSHCPACGAGIRPVDLVPVASWFVLRGRCRDCGVKISPLYPAVEALTGLSFYVAASAAPSALALLKSVVFASALIVVFFIDLRHMIIPDRVVFPVLEAGLLMALFENRFWDSALGAALGFGLFLAIAEASAFLFNREGMGGGDVKFAALLGAFLGVKMTLVASFLSFFAGGIIVLPLMFLGIRKVGEPVPFGPMMVLGGACAMVFGERLVETYYRSWVWMG